MFVCQGVSVSGPYVWLTLFLLGCYHGINPAMGWLFAVALGLQERSTAAVLRAVLPIALGHVISIAAVVALTVVAAATLPRAPLHYGAAAILFAFGLYRLLRLRHPRWVGMRVGFWGLALWGFLMAGAHGAGLMLVPFLTAASPPQHAMPGMPMPAHALGPTWSNAALVVAVHTLGYVLTTAVVAVTVYTKFGVSFLRRAWFNVDLIWSFALIVAGIIVLAT